MKKKEEVAPMMVDAIVAKLKEVGDVSAGKLRAAADEDTKKNAEIVRKLFYTFADELERSFAASVSDEVESRLRELEALRTADSTTLSLQQFRIAQQAAILRRVYAERDELKRQLDELKGAEV